MGQTMGSSDIKKSKAEKQIIENAIKIFRLKQKGIDTNECTNQINDLYKIIEKTKYKDLITYRDFCDAFGYRSIFWDKPIKEMSDVQLSQKFKEHIFLTKNFIFYFPIYCLYDFPEDMKIAQTNVIEFDDLPKEVQNHFITYWKHKFTINREFYRTEKEYVKRKKSSVFLTLNIKANGYEKAIEMAKESAEDALHIIRFMHRINFNLIDIWYVQEKGKFSGGQNELAGLPFDGWSKFVEQDKEQFDILTDIFTKKNPNEIERKIKKSLRIFGIQTSITNKQVRFVLLISSLESLLMTKGDKDYLGWKLAEKSAFIYDEKKLKTYNYVKKCYNKRSQFIHGNVKNEMLVTKYDILEVEGLVRGLIWKLIFNFLQKGYNRVQKGKGVKSIDWYIEDQKF